ncbi:MAG: GNAT family N-acetyltransferase, partial [Acidimicrobiales bacterium]
MPAPSVPPELLEVAGMALRRLTTADAGAVAVAVARNLDHLHPWMPWAVSESATVEFQQDRLAGPAGTWDDASDYGYGLFCGSGDLVGVFGLHRRIAPAALELGYWVDAAHTGRGLGRAGAGALTT